MVERIMLLKLHHAQERAELARRARSLLVGLSGVEEVSVGVPADAAAEKSWDVSIIMSFANEATTQVTLASAAYQAFARELEGKAEVVKAWNFERLS